MTRLTRNLDGDPDLPVDLFIWDGISVHTEKTNKTGSVMLSRLHGGFLAYDAECGFCVRWVERVRKIIEARNIQFVPLATSWVRQRLNLREGEVPDRVWLLLPDGKNLGGADAVIEVARRVSWANPLAFVAGLPGIRGLLHRGYNWIARHRYCLSGQCGITNPTRLLPHQSPHPLPRRAASVGDHIIDWLPLLVMTMATLFTMDRQPAWLFMWVLAIAIFAGFKWIMFRRALRTGLRTTTRRKLAYFFLWPGLDAKAALDVTRKPAVKPHREELAMAMNKMMLGAGLFFIFVRFTPTYSPLLTGWTAMVGLIFMLHFGLFHLITLAWRARGIDVPMMMRNPIASRSVAEFWGRRWNRDFRVLSHELIFQAMVRRIGARAAAALVFLFSGLVHDLVISLPARGGYGLPTLYFMIQFVALWFEGTNVGKRMGLSQGWRGWCFTLLITAAPVMLLFHAPFVHEVILPFARAMGAL